MLALLYIFDAVQHVTAPRLVQITLKTGALEYVCVLSTSFKCSVPNVTLEDVSHGEFFQIPNCTNIISVFQLLTTYKMAAEHYECLELIGKGGSGHVFRVKDRISGEFFAMKVLKAYNAAFRNKAELEAAALVKAACPTSTRLIAAFVVDDSLCLIFPLFYGSLDDVLDSEGSLAPSVVWQVAISTCLSLKTMHAKGITHRDLKPGNILHKGPDHLNLADFGSAGRIGARLRFVGTETYMAPELLCNIANDSEQTGAQDIFSLGVTMYELLRGFGPFARCNDGDGDWVESTSADLERWAVSEQAYLQQLHEAEAGLLLADNALRAFIFSCLQYNPNMRPTAVEVCVVVFTSRLDSLLFTSFLSLSDAARTVCCPSEPCSCHCFCCRCR